ncbi:hypothetical protein GPECTOR_59g607 [Gonium pectorale]|uniref:SMP-LTD domain-containing protein n=1 Tax=Gonium pectorale TaxID=33097 RepID=A0A150G6N8_GONPE|nr:hypothetical protein GPECTOR_59g607 [Gonium pectorale]|eukprot:KXZ45000.1 hypothetical protein GPECTOR_59g607 [Gonium pectorale]
MSGHGTIASRHRPFSAPAPPPAVADPAKAEVVSLHAASVHPLDLAMQPPGQAPRIRPSASERDCQRRDVEASAAAAAAAGGAESGAGEEAAAHAAAQVSDLRRPAIPRHAMYPDPVLLRRQVDMAADQQPPAAALASPPLPAQQQQLAGSPAASSPASHVSGEAGGGAGTHPHPHAAPHHDQLRRLVASAASSALAAGAAATRALGAAWAAGRRRPAAAAAVAALVVCVAPLAAAWLLAELLLLPLLALPAMAVGFATSFVAAFAAALSYRRNTTQAARFHEALGLLYGAGTKLPATVTSAAADAGAAATTAAAAAATATTGAAAGSGATSTLTLVDDAGLSALRDLLGGGSLPSWLADARLGERAEWANALLARAWPAVEGPLRDVLGPAIRAQADLAKPPFIRAVGLADLSLGRSPPRIEAIRVRPLASAVAQAEAVVAVAAAVTAAAASTAGAAAGEPMASEPHVTAASVAPGSGGPPPEGAVAEGGGSSPGLLLSGVDEATVATVAAAVAVQEQLAESAAVGAAGAEPPAGNVAAHDAGGGVAGNGSSAAGGGAGLDGIEVELDFEWQGEPTVGLFVEAYVAPAVPGVPIGGGTVRLAPRLRQVAAAGTLKLVLTPLLPYPPGFGAIQLSMPRAPQLGFAFDFGPGLMRGVEPLAGLVSAFLQPLLQDVVAGALVWPQRVVLPVLPEALTGPLTELGLRTRGLLAVRLLAAEGLAAAGAGAEPLEPGAEVQVEAFTRPDRRLSSAPALCSHKVAAVAAAGAPAPAPAPAAAVACCAWRGRGSLLHLPLQEPRSDVLRLRLVQREGFRPAALLQPNIARGVAAALPSLQLLACGAVPVAPLAADPRVSVTAWVPLRRIPERGADPLGTLVGSEGEGGAEDAGGAHAGAAQLEAALAAARQGAGSGPAAGAVHHGRVAGRLQLEERPGGGGGQMLVWAASGAPPAAPSLTLPPPSSCDPAYGGAVLMSLSYLTTEVLAERLVAAVSESRAATGRLPYVRGMLLVDVLEARDLLGTAAIAAGDASATGAVAAAAPLPSQRASSSGGGVSSLGPDEDYLDELSLGSSNSDSDEEGAEDEGEGAERLDRSAPLKHPPPPPLAPPAAADRVALASVTGSLIASDAPLTLSALPPAPGGGSASAAAEPEMAQVGAGAAAATKPAPAPVPAGPPRDRHGRVRCDPYVELQVTRPPLPADAVPTSAVGSAEEEEEAALRGGGGGGGAAADEADGGGGGGGGGGGTFRKRSGPVPSTVSPGFNLHAEVDDVVPAVEGCELRLQVWHRRWFRPDKRLGGLVLPLGDVLGVLAAPEAPPPPPEEQQEREGNEEGPAAPGQLAAAGCGLQRLRGGCAEGWMQLRGHGAQGGEVRLRLQFLPYLP